MAKSKGKGMKGRGGKRGCYQVLAHNPVEALFPNGRSDQSRMKAIVDDLFLGLGLKISAHEGICAKAPTGEPYIILESLGIREEGECGEPKDTSASKADAISAYLQALKTYAAGKTGTVFWRAWPQVEPHYNGWRVYSRLLISDKPITNMDQAV